MMLMKFNFNSRQKLFFGFQLTGGGANGCLIPVREYLDAYYQCFYDRFFVQLAALESERVNILKQSRKL